MADKRYKIVDLKSIEPVSCPCGSARRAFMDDEDQVASLHLVDIKENAKTHYHKKQTEIYYVLEGEGQMELDGVRFDVSPGTSILIKPECRHRAIGNLRILNIPIPAFDPDDEWIDHP
ncbi:MAG: cupin domain-containing protein [Planctomycetota bacterium]